MVARKPKWKSWFTRQNDGIMSRLRARLTLTTKRSIRGNKMTTSTSGKRKQKKGSAPTGDSQPAAGGELHQIAAGEHPALTTNQGLAIYDDEYIRKTQTEKRLGPDRRLTTGCWRRIAPDRCWRTPRAHYQPGPRDL